MIQVFGNAKTFKKEKSIHGNRINNCIDADFILHQTEVIYSWLYLLKKIPDEGQRVNILLYYIKINETN